MSLLIKIRFTLLNSFNNVNRIFIKMKNHLVLKFFNLKKIPNIPLIIAIIKPARKVMLPFLLASPVSTNTALSSVSLV